MSVKILVEAQFIHNVGLGQGLYAKGRYELTMQGFCANKNVI